MKKQSIASKQFSELATRGRINAALVDATTEAEIEQHRRIDEAEAMNDTAAFIREVRQRLGFSQAQFANLIDVSLETIRNWEQGKCRPTGTAKTLLRILDRAPDASLAAMDG